MKNNTILIIVIIVLVGLTSLTMTGRADIMENEHYFIMGHIYEPYNNTYVTIENTRTMEIQIIELIDCEHELKEYLFDLANLKQGWLNTDDIIITYDDESVKIKINKNTIKIQLDFNQPNDYIPISIITGAVLILSGRYYIKRRKQIMSEENAETENIKTNTQKNYRPKFFANLAMFCMNNWQTFSALMNYEKLLETT